MPPSHSAFFVLRSSYAPAHLALHSFPTRRSSDLSETPQNIATTPDQTPHTCPAWPSGEPNEISPSGSTSAIGSPMVNQSGDRKSTRLNSSHVAISYAVFCLKKKRRI